MDFAVPADNKIKLKECKKKDKYLDLAKELKKLWNMKVTIIPTVIGAFSTETKGLFKGIKHLEVGGRVETIQTTALLRTARIMWRVLETWRDLRRLAVTQTPEENYQLKLTWKTLREIAIIEINECSKLAQMEYKTRHDWVGKVTHWDMCKKFKFDHTNKWYMHNPASVRGNYSHKLQWDHLISARCEKLSRSK